MNSTLNEVSSLALWLLFGLFLVHVTQGMSNKGPGGMSWIKSFFSFGSPQNGPGVVTDTTSITTIYPPGPTTPAGPTALHPGPQ